MAYFLWGHNGSSNHSDEDWIRGSCSLMTKPPAVISTHPEEELRYGIAHLASITNTLPAMAPDDCCLTHRTNSAAQLRRSGGRTILWGWSGAGMSRQLARNLSKFDALVVSERQSAAVLHSAGLTGKTHIGPDLSFLVERRLRAHHGSFREDTVGLCLTMPTNQDYLLYRSYQRLIRYIMSETTLQAALIPYCVRTGRDDTLLHKALQQQLRNWSRLVCRSDGSSQELRGDISLCRCVVGSEGAVAAWSCGIPALCIGATPRATGLAKELYRTWEDVVVPFSTLKDAEELTRRFRRFLRQEDKLRHELESSVPRRRQQALEWQW